MLHRHNSHSSLAATKCACSLLLCLSLSFVALSGVTPPSLSMTAPDGCQHSFDIRTLERDVYPPHSGEWGGMQHGHQCCQQCKGAVDLGFLRLGDGRCHGACDNHCNFTVKQTQVWSVCNKCGKAVKQEG